jgi:hypothetical protein
LTLLFAAFAQSKARKIELEESVKNLKQRFNHKEDDRSHLLAKGMADMAKAYGTGPVLTKVSNQINPL